LAFIELGRLLGCPQSEISFYEDLAKRGSQYLDENLFNGEYYYQNVEYKNLRDKSFVEMLNNSDLKDSEVVALLREEGPKYQYGKGCISDGVIGAWMAKMYGIPTAQSNENVKKNLKAIFAYNFKDDLSEHPCPQRPGYALGQEPGLLLCSWPNGGKPTLPFVYSDEVWTGIEYQVASHMITEGLVREGLTIVKALRSRYDGQVRNPFDEYECGSYYARAMASYALLSALSGFRYNAVEAKLFFAPKLDIRPFKCFFSTASAYGIIALEDSHISIAVIQGELKVDSLEFELDGKTQTFEMNAMATADKPLGISL